MDFWAFDCYSESVALVECGGRAVSYLALGNAADELATLLPVAPSRTLGFLLFEPCISAVQIYLAALRSKRHVPLLLQTGLHPELLAGLVETYQPDWIAMRSADDPVPGYEKAVDLEGMKIHFRSNEIELPSINDNLALLLSTSGSTGSEKLVRLSYSALASNATSITDYLGLKSQDRAVTTLPLAYSFGMSVLNSHLQAGASILLTKKTLMSREFWDLIRDTQVSSLSGVPSQYDMLRRAGLQNRELPALRMLTQAGGRLQDKKKLYFCELCQKMGIEFFVMYGQTEAAPRISYVPPEMLTEKIDSIGIAIPGGQLEAASDSGELVYRGANVMMGYAQCRTDLQRGDDCGGTLYTGDLATVDSDGFFYLTGRMKRFIKLSGTRVNLDDVENKLVEEFQLSMPCVGEDDQLIVVIKSSESIEDSAVLGFFRDRFNVDRGLLRICRIDDIPHTANGKLDYQKLLKTTIE